MEGIAGLSLFERSALERFPIDLVVVLGLAPVFRPLPVLAHHDHRSGVGRLEREQEVEKDEWIRIERSTSEPVPEQEEVGNDPGPEQERLGDDERPGPNAGGYAVRDPFPQASPRPKMTKLIGW